MTAKHAHHIGIDWGSSSFRAYCYDEQFKLLKTIESASGIKHITDQAFEQRLFSLIDDYAAPDGTIVLSGMITSRNGWVETPYIPLPASLNSLTEQSVKRVVQNRSLYFLPGLSQQKPQADVMRGEELALFGATQTTAKALVVMPGTHSKWAVVNDGKVQAFRTIVTGELFDVLLNKTLLGQLATENSFKSATFEQGLRRGFSTNTIVSEFFLARSGVLLNEIDSEDVHSYLSGLLIGNEIKEGLHFVPDDNKHVTLVGADELCERYLIAFSMLDIPASQAHSALMASAFAQLLAHLKNSNS